MARGTNDRVDITALCNLDFSVIVTTEIHPMDNETNAKAAREPRIVELRHFVAKLLKPRISLVVDDMIDHLFNLSSSAQLSSDDRSRVFEAFSRMKSQQRGVCTDFQTGVDQGFEKLITAKSDEKTQRNPAELNLVDLDEFEDHLAIDKIVKAGSERYWVALESMTLRIGEIIGGDPLVIRLPFGLSGLCAAYRAAINPLDFDKKIVLELDRAFARNLLPELRNIYRDINKHLEAQGLLPDVEAKIESGGSKLHPANKNTAPSTTHSHTPDSTAESVAQQADAADTQHTDTQGPQPVTTKAQAGSAAGYSSQAHLRNAAPFTGEITSELARVQSNEQASARMPGIPIPSDDTGTLFDQAQRLADLHGQSLSMPDGLTASMNQNTGATFSDAMGPLKTPYPLSELDAAANQAGASDYLPGRGTQSLNTQIRADVLNRLQQNPYSRSASQHLSPTVLKAQAQALSEDIARLRASGTVASTAAGSLVNQLDLKSVTDERIPLRSSVQMVDDLYETIQTRLPAHSKLGASMDLIKLPLAQLSLTDPDFFLNREHPARLLVERLNELAVLSPINNPRIEQRVNKVLGDINEQFDGDLSIFDQALGHVTELALNMLRQQQRNIQRQVAAEEGRERRIEAQKRVERALIETLPDTALPQSLLNIVDSLWRDHLVVHVVREDAVLDDGLTALSEVNTQLKLQQKRQSALDNGQVERLVSGLRSAAKDAAFLTGDQAAAIARIEQEMLGAADIELVDSTLGELQHFEEPAFSKKIASLPRLRRWVRKARELKKNTWLTDTTSDGSSQNVQLIWSNPLKTRFVFSNEQGQKVRDVDLIQLARWLSHNLKPLKPSEQLSIIERSVFSTLERQQNRLVQQMEPISASELNRSELVDATQSLLRKARRRGASHCAMAIHTDSLDDIKHIIMILQQADIAVTAEGQLSTSTRGILAEVAATAPLETALADWLANSTAAAISLAVIDAGQNSGEDIWRLVEHNARLGLNLSNKAVIVEREHKHADLASVVHNTFERLRDDMPPRLSLKRICRTSATQGKKSGESFQILLDGMPDAGDEISQHSGYHSASLAIALDYFKVSSACKLGERLVSEGRETPVFDIMISTDAALHYDFLDFVLNEVSQSGIGTDRLCFEFRDSLRLREEPIAADFARTLRSIGCLIAVRDVNPSRGSTAQLQSLSPHILALDANLWPPKDDAENTTMLHQAVSDLHHLVGEHVVLRDTTERELAAELGIDFIETLDSGEIPPEELALRMPLLLR